MVELAAYTDGGMVQRNPSPFGFSWAVVYVTFDPGDCPIMISGHVTPGELMLEEVENNLAETVAVLQALRNVPPGCVLVELCTDNQNAFYRGRNPEKQKFGKCPPWVKTEMVELRQRVRPRFRLIGGHPTKAELAKGYREDPPGSGRRVTVSRYNVMADDECKRQAAILRDFLSACRKPEPAADRQSEEPAHLVPPAQLPDAPDGGDRQL